MCGFAGVIDFSSPVDVNRVKQMSASLAHRGPDDDGLLVETVAGLAARRLAIIDLSPAGHQPFTDDSGRHHLLFNGEIYNYKELRAELEKRRHCFRSQTDTEVVLNAYLEWGERCVERFNGMWSFALWDSRERRLFCSRDRFGEKPFYYRRDGDRLVFASELKAFRHDERPLAANEIVVRDFLAHGLVDHGPATFFADTFQLPPAHSLIFSSSGLTIRRYWTLEPRRSPADPAAAVRGLILDSLRLRLRSDVPLGMCLSGGLDSSTVVAGVDHLLRNEPEMGSATGQRLRTFTAYFKDPAIDERRYARAVVDKVKADAHFVTFSDKDVVDTLPAIVEAQDEPFRSTSVIAQWHVMRTAHDAGLKVMLDGQGGDELFAGYPGYVGYFFADLLRRGRIPTFLSELVATNQVRGMGVAKLAAELVRPLVPASLAWKTRASVNGSASLLGPRLRALPFDAPARGKTFPDILRRQLDLVIQTRLPELLHYEDRNSMTHSLEARVPFLDHRLAEVVFSLPGEELIHNGTTKVVLREAMDDVIPDIVRTRTTKLGFDTPEAKWFDGALGDLAQEIFHSRPFIDRGFVDPRAIQSRFQRHRSGQLRAGFEVWRTLSLELWARAFLDDNPTGDHV